MGSSAGPCMRNRNAKGQSATAWLVLTIIAISIAWAPIAGSAVAVVDQSLSAAELPLVCEDFAVRSWANIGLKTAHGAR
jgi:hypothetical protein